MRKYEVVIGVRKDGKLLVFGWDMDLPTFHRKYCVSDNDEWCTFKVYGNKLIAENSKNNASLVFACDDEAASSALANILNRIRGSIYNISVSMDDVIDTENGERVYSLKTGSALRIFLLIE